eukprot:jgi/Hompol1/2217/HPOL_001648-RA
MLDIQCPPGVAPADAAFWEDLRKDARAEKRQNDEELARLLGKPVVYGMIIQLRNIYSDRVLSVNSKETCSHESISMRVGADANVRKESLFRILPRYRIRAEGETVRIRDVVVIQSIKTENFLNVGRISHAVSPSAFPAGGEQKVSGALDRSRVFDDVMQPLFFEASAALSPHGWIVHLFDSHQIENQKRIRAGQYVRFYHKEKEGYLSAEARDTRVHLLHHQINPLHPKDSDSSTTFWQIVPRQEYRGGEFAATQLVRLRHVMSNSYLEVEGIPTTGRDTSPVRATSNRISSAAPFGVAKHANDHDKTNDNDSDLAAEAPQNVEFLSDTQPQAKRMRVRLVPSHSVMLDPEDDPTLFVLRPVNFDTDDHLCTSSFFRIQHYRTGTWLHAASMQLNTSLSSSSNTGLSNHSSFNTAAKLHKIVAMTDTRGDDYFSVSVVDPSMASACKFITSMALPLKYWLMRQRIIAPSARTKFPLTARGEKKTKRILTSLIYHATNSAEVDPFKRKTGPIQLHQKYLRETGIIDILICMLELPFDLAKRQAIRTKLAADFVTSTEPYVHESESEVTIEDMLKNQEPHLTSILQLIYALLQVFLINADEANQQYLARDFNTIANHIKLRLGATNTLMQLVSGNRSIIEGVSNQQIDFFIDLMIREKRASFLEFLIALCHVNGQPVARHQAYIATRLLQTHRSQAYLFRTHFAKSDIASSGSVHEAVIQIPDRAGRMLDANYKPLHVFCHPLSEEHKSGLVAFFRNSLALYEALCKGHNQHL